MDKKRVEAAPIKQGNLLRCPTCNRCLKKTDNYCCRCGTKILK